MKKLLLVLVLLLGPISFVLANDLSPYAGTKLVLDNIKDFPELTTSQQADEV